MKILVVNTQVPFISGGAELHADNLLENLRMQGHNVEHVKIPFKWYPPEQILDHILAVRLLDLTESSGGPIDLVIGLRFPAYLIKHHNKVLWILHQFREAYELWDTDFRGIPRSVEGEAIRKSIIEADNKYIPEAKKVFANSKTVSNRLKKYNNIKSKPLYHPPPDFDKFYLQGYENYILYPSRLNSIKRQHIAIEAMKHVKSNVKLFIAGGADSKDYENHLIDLVNRYNLNDKVQLLGSISQKDKLELYANALALLYIPFDEDYGYVTLESFLSKKAVITCNDSGGPLEFIQDKNNGLVCEPNAESIAESIEYLINNKQKAFDFGTNAYDFIKELDISWEKVVEELTS